jgi:hypothetical protein
MISKVTKYFTVLAVSLLAVVLAGCGAGNREGTNGLGGSPLFGNVATVGDTACVQCHSATTETLTGETIVSQYQQTSPHNQDGLGCESCHGGGAEHNGVGPIPYSTPDANRCATCHTGTTDVAFKNSFGNMTTIVPQATNSNTAFTASKHANVVVETGNSCRRCHSNEGGVLGAKYGLTGPKDLMDDPTYQGAVPLSSKYTAITCDTCHGHGGGLREVKTRDTNGNLVNWNPSASNKANDQFNLCTSCHGLKTNDGTIMASGDPVYGTDMNGNPTTATTTTTVGHHETSWYRVIATTHNNNPDNTLYGITGYVVRTKGENPCFDCHGHEAMTNTVNSNPQDPKGKYDASKATIHTDWAQSAHAGGLLTAKITAAGATATSASLTDTVMNASITASFAHADWSSAAEQACQKCHTATGSSNYLNSPTTYDPQNNDFSHLAGWTKNKASAQRELLYCWSCHSNAGTGKLRNPGAITTTEYTYNGAAVTFPDVSSSNTCVACHSGRGNSDTTATKEAASRSTRNAAHHAPAAATLFSTASHVGYEFPGASYANPSYFQHDKIGTSAAEAATGSSGPCVACHMGPSSSDGKPSHTLAVLSEDGSAINNQALCNKCHTSHPMSVAVLTTEKAGATNATLLLSDILKQLNGQTNYQLTDMTASAFIKGATATVGDYGAFQNSLYNGTDVGAYAHNRYYLKRLIFDSIDWAKNGQLTGSITIPAGYPDAATWFKADATTGVAARP